MTRVSDRTQTASRVHAFTDDALGRDDATAVAARIRTGQISAREAVEAAIARAEGLEPALHAIAHPDFDRARQRAADPGSAEFAGVPAAFKDNIPVQGMPMTEGSRAVPARAQGKDGRVARQLRATGINPIATTTMPEFGWTATTETLSVRPTTHGIWGTPVAVVPVGRRHWSRPVSSRSRTATTAADRSGSLLRPVDSSV